MDNPIDAVIRILGEMPKNKRRIILLLMNIPFYMQVIFVWILHTDIGGRPFWFLLDLFLLLLNIKILSLGGWWWANNDNE